MSEWLLRGAHLPDAGVVDLRLRDGRIAEIGEALPECGETVIGVPRAVVLPGLVDLHCHLPRSIDGRSECGLETAAMGGFTAVCAMSAPGAAAASRATLAENFDLYTVGSVSADLEGRELADFGAADGFGKRPRMFSDSPRSIADPLLMRAALQDARTYGAVVLQHPEDVRLSQGLNVTETGRSARLGFAGAPRAAEASIIARDVLLASEFGGQLHVSGVSTRESVAVVRWAKAQGWPITADVAPHSLVLTEELLETYDPIFKLSPPLRCAEDVDAIRLALADGTIDAVASHHREQPPELKECEWEVAAVGGASLRSALLVVIASMVRPGLLDWAGVVDRMSVAPAAISGLCEHGNPLVRGAPATLTLVSPAAITPADPASGTTTRALYAPGLLGGAVAATFLRGKPTWLSPALT